MMALLAAAAAAAVVAAAAAAWQPNFEHAGAWVGASLESSPLFFKVQSCFDPKEEKNNKKNSKK